MRVRPVLVSATLLLLALLGWVQLASAAGPAAWTVALCCWAVMAGWVAATAPGLGPADLVTLLRGVLACSAAGLVVAGAGSAGSGPPGALFALCVVALALDAVDGQVARRTGTTSPFGGRFDGEADAFLMLVLSVQAALVVGGWVLVLGLLRYAFGVAAVLLPWLAQPLPFRWWRKVVTAVAGVALVAAVPQVLPPVLVTAGLLVALALLLESFGRDVGWAWRRRPAPLAGTVVGP